METLPQAFAPLRAYDQFIVFKYAESRKPGKLDKIPVNHLTLKSHDPHDPSIWLPADEAIAKVKALGNSSSGYGVGFTITSSDPFFFLDIDNAYNNGSWSPTATELVQQFQGAAVEVSSSNRGLHILGRGIVPEHRTRDIAGYGLELYDKKRFVALTGTHARGSIDFDCTPALNNIVERYFPSQTKNTDRTAPVQNMILTDEQIVRKALGANSAAVTFGSRISFRQLWEKDVNALRKYFPKDGSYDESSADFSLALHLAFWTGRNEEQIERLMRQSALYREKWERGGNYAYLSETITKACNTQTLEYTGGKSAVVSTQPPTAETAHVGTNLTESNVTGLQQAEQQLEIFRNCVYVLDDHKVLIPSGRLVTEKQFNVVYGGMAFVLDYGNSKITDQAFKVFTQSQINRFPKVHRTCFKPNLPMGSIVTINGETCVNTYKPPSIHRVAGDITPFLNHIEKLFPDERDRHIIIGYMAAVVQMQGIKFQWCPLIQGVQGNGKSMLTYILAYCVGRQYTHFPKASELDNKFNGWLMNKVLIAVEDIFVSRDKMQIMEAIKPMITGETQGIERKGFDQVTHEIVANFILNTNHKDALKLTRDDRRFACFYTAQQEVADLKRDRMTGSYFPDLFYWLMSLDGYAICCNFLSTYPLTDDFKKSLRGRAPLTSSTDESIALSLGILEIMVQEAIDEGRIGFRGNFVSSYHLGLLLKENNMGYKMNSPRLGESLGLIGYVKHPYLVEGRLNNPVHPDPVKTRIYVKKDTKESLLTEHTLISKAYSDAQGS